MKRYIRCITAAALLLFAGCDTSGHELPEHGTQGISEIISENAAGIPSPDPSAELMSEGSGGQPSTDAPDPASSANGASGQNSAHEEYKAFKGLPKAEAPLNTVNNKDYRPSLLCFGGGNTFFMWNGTVYRHNGRTTEALFEKNAYSLNYYDETLYFIENDRYDINGMDLVHIEGILYSFDLNGGELKALTEQPVSLPVVCGGEIFCTDYALAGDPEPTGICRVSENGVPERLYDGIKYIGYGDHLLKYDWSDGEKVFFSRGDTRLLLENVHPYWDCIVGDSYYYRSTADNSLNCLSVLTGELTTLGAEDNGFTCLDYTVLNDEIYIIDAQSALCRYDRTNGGYTRLALGYSFRYLYADDKNVYGVARKREEETAAHSYHFIKISPDGSEVEILA